MITCGKNTKLSESSVLPDVSAGIAQTLQNLRVGVIRSTQVDGKTQIIPIYRMAMAAIQPMPEKLAIAKEGERSWKWSTIYAQPDLDLTTGDLVVIKGITYKIMSEENWAQYGFLKYDCIENYRNYAS